MPDNRIKDTPIFLLATAGVRLLDPLEGKTLLKEICHYTRHTTEFLLPDCDSHIQVIPGETEGLYGWIAANYLLGGFNAPQKHDHGKGHHTYGFLDMGGASAQIAFAPNSTEAQKHADNLKLLRLRNVNGAINEYHVFVTTWLGFGVHQARKRYIEALIEESGVEGELPDPCLPVGLKISSEGDILTPDKINGEKIYMVGTGRFKECLSKTFPLLNKDAPCEDAPCLLNGVHVPAIDFDVNHFVGVSEYWHTTHEVFQMEHEDKAYDFHTYQSRVLEFCSSDWKNIKERVGKKEWGNKVDENTVKDVCFKANWIINVLHDGIGIPRVALDEHEDSGHNGTKEVLDNARGYTGSFRAINKIDDTEVSWTLGKMLLYAASEISPGKGSNLPVGFGSNVAGIPSDFQYPSLPPHANFSANATQPQAESWRDRLFESKAPRRIPGFFLFLIIICIAIFFLCGKDRRSRFYKKVFSRFGGPGGRFHRRKGGLFTPKISLPGTTDRLLEGGIRHPEDFELGDMNSDEDAYSDDSVSSKTGKTSGWATPRLRIPHLDGSGEDYTTILGGNNSSFGLGINAMDRSGLFPRTESRESLHGIMQERGRKSRRASPTRHKSPLMGSLSEI